ncbi:proline racemase family protein [Virgibacillus necropolis]|uniref:Proline racemase n=1 Tax=Virgibacillus necropolis TaxID=163877 RepID=A0A221MAD2_9BACI|nr:proline racemase family protein [Virgibacillus necropolis]ASN04560.1 proline racemase [Virgibacillus necropolis]
MHFEKMFTTIDTHVAGEAFRIVVQSTINLSEQEIKLNHDLLQGKFQYEKEFLLNEPRGHRGMNGCIVIPSKVADYGLLFFNHDSKIQFKYGGLVASITAMLETGNLFPNESEQYKVETVNGIYTVKAKFDKQEVTTVYFESDRCHVVEKTPEYCLVEVDGSRKYLVFELPDSLSEINLEQLSSINRWGRKATERTTKKDRLFDGIIISEPINVATNEVRSVTFEKDGTILRSPGIDSTLAIFTARLIKSDQHVQLTNRSIFDSLVAAKLIPETDHRFSIETQGFTTGMHQFIYDQTDPLKSGFLLK